MSKYRLTISPDYVPDWTYIEAVRELFQNALDNQVTNPENEMYFDYDKEAQVLRIGNKTSVLQTSTLLMGSSSKRDDAKTIGKHGEGYKVALMVLLRSDKGVTFYNYGAKETWKTRMVKSRKFQGLAVPEITVEKQSFFRPVPNHDLIIEVQGISEEEYQGIVKANLHLQQGVEKYSTEFGDVLLKEEHRGRVYVNGLFVAENTTITYGYNFKPQQIKLDRDRRMIDTFDLLWETSQIWREVEQPELLSSLIYAEVADVKFLSNRFSRNTLDTVKVHIEDKFVEEHGEDAIPVSNQQELEQVQEQGSKAVFVSEQVATMIKPRVSQRVGFRQKTIVDKRIEWLEKIASKLTEEEVNEYLEMEDLVRDGNSFKRKPDEVPF